MSNTNTNFKQNALPTTCNDLRQSFIDYFVRHGHTHVASSSLVPANDKTLLFTNAGMVQFKDLFLGKEKRNYTKAVTCQKCMRAGGKHNDLENVGYTKRHHTFFEMLGNFSFGDYFKREAINYAWDYLTNVLQLPSSKLWITVHKKDTEAEKIWLEEIKINPQRFSKCDDKDNFWAMGETGPCGFCSEIYYDYGDTFQGNPPGDESDEGERYVEIWNLVFMEFERDNAGNLHKLPNPSIDTGMGLERLTAVMQHETTQGDNYAIDLFQKFLFDASQNPVIQPLFAEYIKTGKIQVITEENNHSIAKFAKLNILDKQLKLALRVVCEHSRSALFMLADGITPSNEGQGYILRKIIRRAMRFLYLLGLRQPLLWQFALLWAEPHLMGNTTFYPEIIKVTQNQAESLVAIMIRNEENQFINTLEKGIDKFKSLLNQQNNNIFSGKDAFYLYDTFGFPLEVTKEMAQEVDFTVDENAFNAELEKQRENSRATSKFACNDLKLNVTTPTKFIGYQTFNNSQQATVLELHTIDGKVCEKLNLGEEGIIILDTTTFYAESGGQIGDTGRIYTENGNEFIVNDTKKNANIFLHYGQVVQGNFYIKQNVNTVINTEQRQATTLNHSSAHLLHQALRQTLGEHATQKGSYVDSQRLRFDIAHHSAITSEQLSCIEQIVNAKIRDNLTVITEEKSLIEAKNDGVLALFDEKYGDTVRVVKMQDFSAELCGGTHVKQTGEIGLFKIILETSVASGVRRIEALTGEQARLWYENYVHNFHTVAQLLKAEQAQVFHKLNQILEQNTTLNKELQKLQQQIVNNQNANLVNEAQEINGFKVLVKHIPNIDIKTLRNLVDQCKQKLSSAIIILATITNDKIQLIISVSDDYLTKITANDIMQHIAPQINGSGGGRKDLAQGGGTKLDALDESLYNTTQWLAQNYYM